MVGPVRVECKFIFTTVRTVALRSDNWMLNRNRRTALW